jgi:hypothetical protein
MLGRKDRRCCATSAVNKSRNRSVDCPLDMRHDSPDAETARRSEPPRLIAGYGICEPNANALTGHGSKQGNTGRLIPHQWEFRLQAADGKRPPEGGTPTYTARPPSVTWSPEEWNHAPDEAESRHIPAGSRCASPSFSPKRT